MSKLRLPAIILILLSGCSQTQTNRISLTPEPDTCQASEVRMSAFSTNTFVVCWDSEGGVIGMTGGEGLPVASVPLAILSAGSTTGGAYILGSKLGSAARAIPRDIDVSGEIGIQEKISGDLGADLSNDTEGGDLLDELLDIIGG